MEPDDITLNARVAQGDRRAFTILVARYERRVRGFLARAAGGQMVDDLAQETFVRAWQRAAQFDGSGSYGAWLIRIGWNLFMDDLRRTRRLRRLHLEAEAGKSEDFHPGDDARLDLEAALATLAPVERATIALCDVQGWTHSEAAEVLDLPLGTLKSIAARSKRKLREQLSGFGEVE